MSLVFHRARLPGPHCPVEGDEGAIREFNGARVKENPAFGFELIEKRINFLASFFQGFTEKAHGKTLIQAVRRVKP